MVGCGCVLCRRHRSGRRRDYPYKLPVRFTDDYGAHAYWLVANVNNLLPAVAEPYWPDFLQIAMGIGVNDRLTQRELAIGLDFDLESLFRTENEDWLLFLKTVNMFHIPAPAIKFTDVEEPAYYLFQRN